MFKKFWKYNWHKLSAHIYTLLQDVLNCLNEGIVSRIGLSVHKIKLDIVRGGSPANNLPMSPGTLVWATCTDVTTYADARSSK